jgi:hypothetical protein
MKSIEFLTEAEANIAQKKLDKYLDMLSNDNLRVLIPMVKQALSMNEDDKPQTQYYGKIAPNARRASTPTSTPTLTAPTLSNKGSEETKLDQVISKLSASEKKELLSLLQKEAKTRPAAKKPAKKQDAGDKKSTGKGMMGCLLPLVGIIGLLALIPDSPNNATEPVTGASQGSASDISDEQRGKSYAWDVTRDIKSKMRDPDSAKFKEVQTLKGTTYMVVGYVKGKNAFGGYSDWTRFISASTDNANITMIEEDDPAEFAKAWNNLVVGSSVVWSDSSDYTQFIK